MDFIKAVETIKEVGTLKKIDIFLENKGWKKGGSQQTGCLNVMPLFLGIIFIYLHYWAQKSEQPIGE